MPKTKIDLKIVNGDTNVVLLKKRIGSVREVDKLVKDITDYKVVVVPHNLYDYLKQRGLEKERLKGLTNTVMKEVILDLQTFISALLGIFDKTDKSIERYIEEPRIVEVVITYYLTRWLSLGHLGGKPVEFLTGLGITRKEIRVSAKGFFLNEINKIGKVLKSGVVYCENGKATFYYYWDYEEAAVFKESEMDYLPKVFTR